MRNKRIRLPLAVVGIAALIVCAWLLSGRVRSQGQVTLATWTEPALPDTAAGNQLEAYMGVLNVGDRARLEEFVREYFSPVGPGGGDINDRIKSQVRFYNTVRGLNLFRVMESSETAITVVAQLRLTKEWRQITLMVEENAPHRISGVMIMPTDAPPIEQSIGQGDETLQQVIDAYARGLLDADRFSGVVVVAEKGEPIFEAAYGIANKEQNIPIRLETRFSVASVGKIFTALAIAQLVDTGRLSYSDTIDRYLTDYPDAVAQQVTIDHLLTHRSGIADFFADEEGFAKVQESNDPQQDYLSLFVNEPLHFVPGTRFEYSNSNYILLGAIVEKVSGQTYADYVDTHIFAPAGMSETVFSAEEVDINLIAHGYTELDTQGEMTVGVRRSAAAYEPATASAAGGVYTTAADLLRFDRSLRAHQLLSPAATDQLLIPRVDDDRPGYRYGYGFSIREADDEPIVGHSGGFPGVDAQFEMYWESGYTVIVLSNYELVSEPIARYIQQVLSR